MNNFVRSKFKEKAEYHKRLDTLRNQQQNASAAASTTTSTSTSTSLIDVASPVNYTAGSTSAINNINVTSGNETAQSFTEDFVATIVRRFRPLRQSASRINAVTAAVESVMYAQIQSLYASLFADRDEFLAQKMKRLLTLSPGNRKGKKKHESKEKNNIHSLSFVAHVGVPQVFIVYFQKIDCFYYFNK